LAPIVNSILNESMKKNPSLKLAVRVWVASLDDAIAAKEAAGRPKDKATLEILKADTDRNEGTETQAYEEGE
jgi:hypothetical protein